MKVYETGKMRVEVSKTKVTKIFKDTSSSKKRYKREKEALKRLKGIDGFPQIISYQDQAKTIIMSHIEGDNKLQLSDQSLLKLRALIKTMLAAGISRHALPERDLLITDSGDVSMVDFERVTLRRHRLSIKWFFAKRVTEYHLLRLIWNHNSSLLSPDEKQTLQRYTSIRNKLQKLKLVRSFYRKHFRLQAKFKK